MSTATGRWHGSPDRRLFVVAALGILVIVFAGFARSYFLKAWFDTPPLSLLVHVHGLVMTSWFVLFLVQTCLIETHRVAMHRRLGVFGAALAVAIVLLGPYVAFRAAAREVHAHARSADFFLLVLGYDAVIVALFAGFVACAIVWRKRGDFHKRLMLLATLSLLTPALARLPFWSGNLQVLWAGDLCVLLCVAVDVRLYRRLHPVFAIGAPSIAVATYLAFVGASTPAWAQFAQHLVS